jgi:hypothetical protein
MILSWGLMSAVNAAKLGGGNDFVYLNKQWKFGQIFAHQSLTWRWSQSMAGH